MGPTQGGLIGESATVGPHLSLSAAATLKNKGNDKINLKNDFRKTKLTLINETYFNLTLLTKIYFKNIEKKRSDPKKKKNTVAAKLVPFFS